MVLSTHKTKTAALVLSLALLVMSFFDAPAQCMLQLGCGITGRLCYHFFHANLFHAFINVWCLLAIAFYYDLEDWEFFLAWIIAATIPNCALCIKHCAFPIVGFSGICFALMGIILYKVARKRYYLSWIIPFIVMGFFLPGIAATVHLYCFVVGLIVSLGVVVVLRHTSGVHKRKDRP